MAKKIIGEISITSLGKGYLKSEELKESVRIDAPFLNTALHNDKVEAVLFPRKKNEKKQSGEVVKVLKRAKNRFVGTVEKKKGQKFAFVSPDDPKMYVDIFIPGNKLQNKTKVLTEIVSWKDPKKNPEGRVLEVIGKKGKMDTEMHSIVLEKGLAVKFPKKVKEEARKAKRKTFSVGKRRDFRKVATFTIDPEDAKDFDDALSLKKLKEGVYEVGVHIADVSYYVEEGSATDKEAKKRGFSIYLVDRTIPMLPEDLSNDACSLRPNEDRAAFSVVFKMKKNGEVLDTWFGETVICSKKRFTYKEAQDVLQKKKGRFYEELLFLNSVSEKLKKERERKGALRFDDDELLFQLDHDGVPIGIFRKEHLPTHGLIEEFMILANRSASEKFNTLYRIHEPPDKEMIDNLLSFLSGLGYKIKVKGREMNSSEINNLIEKVRGKDEEFLVKKAVLRSMSKAAYSVKNKKHFGLAVKEYMHFTSPIRRYADLMMHRIVKKKLKGKKVNAPDYDKVAKEISLRELDVLEAERDSIAYKQVEYMLRKKGELFEAIISGVTNSGIFVQELETKAEGMISIRDMDDDYYILDEENYALIGTRKRKRYALGNKIKVRLVGGSLEMKQLDFTLA